MSGVWGNSIKYSIFGESHGPSIGIIIDGLPSGINLNMDAICFELDRRRPGKNKLSTERSEKDQFDILSGYFNNRTTGSPLCITMSNCDASSSDYKQQSMIMRPGHADFPALVKHSGFNDYRGGGHFSGRLTAPLVFAGAVAKQLLAKDNILVGSHIAQIGHIKDSLFDSTNIDHSLLNKLHRQALPVIRQEISEQMEQYIYKVKSQNNSVGGMVEVTIINTPPGIGSPFFDSLESIISHLAFSVPSVKGIEFGSGFGFSSMLGSEAADEYFYEDANVKTFKNNNGGILGGLTTGMPIIFRAAIKPTPSIGLIQQSINTANHCNTTLAITGRHDPCIVPRVVPVLEAIAAIAFLELYFDRKGV